MVSVKMQTMVPPNLACAPSARSSDIGPLAKNAASDPRPGIGNTNSAGSPLQTLMRKYDRSASAVVVDEAPMETRATGCPCAADEGAISSGRACRKLLANVAAFLEGSFLHTIRTLTCRNERLNKVNLVCASPINWSRRRCCYDESKAV